MFYIITKKDIYVARVISNALEFPEFIISICRAKRRDEYMLNLLMIIKLDIYRNVWWTMGRNI